MDKNNSGRKKSIKLVYKFCIIQEITCIKGMCIYFGKWFYTKIGDSYTGYKGNVFYNKDSEALA